MNHIRPTLLGLILCLPVAMTAVADELLVDSVTASASSVPAPQSGVSMEQVRQQYGAATTEHPTVSVNAGPHQPPITRWDYSDFSVFFEHDHVIHSVAHRAAAN